MCACVDLINDKNGAVAAICCHSRLRQYALDHWQCMYEIAWTINARLNDSVKTSVHVNSSDLGFEFKDLGIAKNTL